MFLVDIVFEALYMQWQLYVMRKMQEFPTEIHYRSVGRKKHHSSPEATRATPKHNAKRRFGHTSAQKYCTRLHCAGYGLVPLR